MGKCCVKHWNSAEMIMDTADTLSRDCKRPHFTLRDGSRETSHIYLDEIGGMCVDHSWTDGMQYLFDWAKDHVSLLIDNYNQLN